MVVFLQPFSTGKRQFIETDEKREIACVTYSIKDRMGDTRRVKKVNKSNSYNEEFDPGSG